MQLTVNPAKRIKRQKTAPLCACVGIYGFRMSVFIVHGAADSQEIYLPSSPAHMLGWLC